MRNPEAAIETQLASMLRTPGLHRLLHVYSLIAQSEILPMLYDQWATSTQYPSARILETFIHRWNVDVGTDSNRSPGISNLYGEDLFAHDLEELCVAVNTLMQTDELSADQIDTCTKAEAYYRELGGVNPGAISIARGWHELMLVIRESKHLTRCIAPECGRLLVYDNQGAMLSGTPQGYHSEKCLETHTGGTAIQPANLPGAQEAAEVVGQVIQNPEAPQLNFQDRVKPEGEVVGMVIESEAEEAVTATGEQQPEGPGGQADIPDGSTPEQ